MNNKKHSFFFLLCMAGSLCTFSACENFNTLSVSHCSPGNHSVGIETSTYVTVEFSQDVMKNDVEQKFSLSGDATGTVAGHFVWETGSRFVFVPREELSLGSRYNIVIPRTVRDKDNNKMKEDFLSDFYVGSDLDSPEIVSSVPVYSPEEGTVTNLRQQIIINFNEPMNCLSVQNAFTLSPAVAGYYVWSNNNSTMTFVPSSDMTYGSHYRFTISESAKDISGNALRSAYTVFFITGDDFTDPVLDGIFRYGDVTRQMFHEYETIVIGKNDGVTFVFSEEMKRSETETAISVTPSVAGSFSWNAASTECTFLPDDPLDPEAVYVVRVEKTASDINDRKLQNNFQCLASVSANDSRLFAVSELRTGIEQDIFTTTVPLPIVGWPYLFDPDDLLDPVDPLNILPKDQDFYLCFRFLNSAGESVKLDPDSVLDGGIIFEYIGGGSPQIDDIKFADDYHTLIIEFEQLTPKVAAVNPVLYRLTITGGKNGIKDENGNWMADSFILDFKRVSL
jgi:hypothetical protein